MALCCWIVQRIFRTRKSGIALSPFTEDAFHREAKVDSEADGEFLFRGLLVVGETRPDIFLSV